MPTTLNLDDFTILGKEDSLNLVAEELFFKDREEGILRPNTIPLPSGVDAWMKALYQGEEVHIAQAENTLYVLADTTIFGYCLFKLVSVPDNDTTFKVAYQGGNRIISSERRNVIMAQTMQDIINQYQGGQINPIALGGVQNFSPAAPQQIPVAGEGISRGIDVKRLHREISVRAYVAGYVMNNAPQTTLSVNRKKAQDGTVTANIVAKESKPSRCLAVLMALPANYVMHNRALASPEEIRSGMVDADDRPGEMIYEAFSVTAAIGYINAIGGRVPEYAPTAEGAPTHWTVEDIVSGKPEVTYVTVHATENRSRKSRSNEQFRFSLKSTSGRRSLYTQDNVVWLRAVKHSSVKCTSTEDEYRLNEMAFGAMRYRSTKDSPDNALQRAMRDCPTQIWTAKYNVDGKEVEGIGSIFFSSTGSVKTGAGETTAVKPLHYIPWYLTGDKKPTMPSRVERIVTRSFQAADGNRKEGMVTTAVTLKENPNDSLFKPCQRFLDFIITTGFLSRDKLVSLGGRASKAKTKSYELTGDQQRSLDMLLRSASVMAEIDAVRDSVTSRDMLQNSNG